MGGLVILCSGQGGQTPEMLEALRKYPAAEIWLERFPVVGDIYDNAVAQPLLCLYQLAVWAVVAPQLPEVELFAGYSLGEVSAYGCAGWLTPEHTLELARRRGRLMSAAAAQTSQGMMAVIGLKRETIESICRECGGTVAIINGDDHFICGLPENGMVQFEQLATEYGVQRLVRLKINIASHTPFMASASEPFREYLSQLPVAPGLPVLTALNGSRVNSKSMMIDSLSAQLTRPLEWRNTLESAIDYGGRIFLELGPGNALCKMVKEIDPEVEARSVSEFKNFNLIGRWVSQVMARLD